MNGEPITGSLAPVVGPVATVLGDALGPSDGPAVVIGSGGTDSLGGSGSLGPVLLIGGVAAVGAGVAFAPQIEQALADAGIVLPPPPQIRSARRRPRHRPRPVPVRRGRA